MGRRAVKRIDPAIDLSHHLKSFDDLPDPWDQQTLFDVSQPLEVEVGSGKGLFMRTASGAAPQHNFLGIEIAHRYARWSAAKLAKLERTNAVMISGDAQKVFAERVPTASLEAVHIYFPDPWWKKRHRKRRVVNREFVTQIVRALRIGGSLHFWTDVKEYFDCSLELLADFAELGEPAAIAERDAAHHLDYHTHFERRTRLAGEPVYRCCFLRTESSL